MTKFFFADFDILKIDKIGHRKCLMTGLKKIDLFLEDERKPDSHSEDNRTSMKVSESVGKVPHLYEVTFSESESGNDNNCKGFFFRSELKLISNTN